MTKNINKLKGKIAENDLNQKQLASKLGINELTLSNKMKGKSDFTIEESEVITKVLNLTLEEYLEIFFNGELEFNSR